jgi:predicted ferric reductase
MHVTKRFGIVAASQLPLHYLLAMKSNYSPLQRVLKTSHEALNLIHQVLGRVILIFLMLHATFYLNFFIRLGVLSKRARDLDVVMGLLSITILSALGMTAIGVIRRANYQLFYAVHVIGSSLILVLLFFHVVHIRLFIYECGAIQLTNVVLRYYQTKEVIAELKPIQETNLVQITSQTGLGRPFWKPGQHVYLRLSNSGIWSYLRSNPFTISSLPEDKELVLVARVQRGNTLQLASIATSTVKSGAPTTAEIYLEGPYGHSQYQTDFAKFDKVLLVAGGVGATYIIPLWKHIALQRLGRSKHDQSCHFVWTVRSIADTKWAQKLLQRLPDERREDDELDLHVTAEGKHRENSESQPRSKELSERISQIQGQAARDAGFVVRHGRPDLKRIVDGVFARHSGRVAVLFCGPGPMMRQMKIHIRKYVMLGRDVYWHAEEFGL